jgi:hypothetical protein
MKAMADLLRSERDQSLIMEPDMTSGNDLPACPDGRKGDKDRGIPPDTTGPSIEQLR